MNHKKITKSGPLEYSIVKLIPKNAFESRIKETSTTGKVEDAVHCFETATNWYQNNISFGNPYNFNHLHAELHFLEGLLNDEKLYQQIVANRHIVSWGIGVGDTEILFLIWQIMNGEKNMHITGIDANLDFLKTFQVALRTKAHELSDDTIIHYQGLNALFEQVTPELLYVPKKSNIHICLGGTIGNFLDQERIFRLFRDTMNPQDMLVVGYQQDTHIKILFEKYRHNPLFAQFVWGEIPRSQRGELIWSCDTKTGFITASNARDNSEVFRSRKYDPLELRRLASSQDFSLLYDLSDTDKNIGVQIYAPKK